MHSGWGLQSQPAQGHLLVRVLAVRVPCSTFFSASSFFCISSDLIPLCEPACASIQAKSFASTSRGLCPKDQPPSPPRAYAVSFLHCIMPALSLSVAHVFSRPATRSYPSTRRCPPPLAMAPAAAPPAPVSHAPRGEGAVPFQPLQSQAAWTAEEMRARKEEWTHRLTPDDLAELEAATAAALATGKETHLLTQVGEGGSPGSTVLASWWGAWLSLPPHSQPASCLPVPQMAGGGCPLRAPPPPS